MISGSGVSVWMPEEELYLHSILLACERLSNAYLEKHRKWRNLQARIKIPVIVVGSFTGITSFGSETFPPDSRRWISAGVGVVSIGIAILNMIESYFKLGENANAALNTFYALQQLREDINKELSIPDSDRSASGVVLMRDIFIRYQQILSQAPLLDHGDVNYVNSIINNKICVLAMKHDHMYKKQIEDFDNIFGFVSKKDASVSPGLSIRDGLLKRMKTFLYPSQCNTSTQTSIGTPDKSVTLDIQQALVKISSIHTKSDRTKGPLVNDISVSQIDNGIRES